VMDWPDTWQSVLSDPFCSIRREEMVQAGRVGTKQARPDRRENRWDSLKVIPIYHL